MQKIGLCLWFDKNAEAAARFYIAALERAFKG